MNCFDELKKIIQEKVGSEVEITMDSELKSLGIDSLDLLETVIDVETKLGIKFEDEELVSFVTVGDVVRSAQGK